MTLPAHPRWRDLGKFGAGADPVHMEGLPAGTVTFVFTDIEGFTRLLNGLGAEGYARALAEHRVRIRAHPAPPVSAPRPRA